MVSITSDKLRFLDVNGFSSHAKVNRGLQGSLLGATLFTLYVFPLAVLLENTVYNFTALQMIPSFIYL